MTMPDYEPDNDDDYYLEEPEDEGDDLVVEEGE